MDFSRKMSARERMRLWFPNINVVVAARVRGGLDMDRLSAAMRQANRKHPLTRVKIVLKEDGSGVFTNAGVPEVPLSRKTLQATDEFQKTIQQALRAAWDFQKGPLLRLMVLSADPNDHYLIFCGHHAICDGRSFIFLIRDLLGYYNGWKTCHPEEVTVPNAAEERIPEGVKKSFLGQLFISAMNKKWQQKGIRFDQQDYLKMHQSFWKNRKTTIQLETIEREAFSPFIDKCRSENCSVNSALYTAFLLAQLQVQQEKNARVLVPIDLRGYLDPPLGAVFGYYASALVIGNPVDGRRSFWLTARKFDRATAKQKKTKHIFSFTNTSLFDPSLLDGAIFAQNAMLEDDQALALSEKIFNKLGTKLMVSNLGRIEPPENEGSLKLVDFIPPILTSGSTEKVVEAATYNGHLNLSITHNPDIVPADTVENIFSLVRNSIVLLGK